MVWRPSGEVESMGWNRLTRRTDRRSRRPDIEALEIRSLLPTTASTSHVPAAVHPHHAHAHAQAKEHLTRPHPTQDASSSLGTSFDTIDGASKARAIYGVDGTGTNVAVIDTGVDYTDKAL